MYKKHAEQLSNAMDWFRGSTRVKAKAVPVLVHPTSKFDKKAAVPTGCKVVTKEKLVQLLEALNKYATALSNKDTFRDARRVATLLGTLGLTADAYLETYMVPARPGG